MYETTYPKEGKKEGEGTYSDPINDLRGRYPYFETKLYNASMKGREQEVESFLQNPSIEVHTGCFEGNRGYFTPLYAASDFGRLEIVKLLMNHKDIDVNKGRSDGTPPIFIAAFRGRIEVVKELLKSKEVTSESIKIIISYLESNSSDEKRREILKILKLHTEQTKEK